MLDYNSKIASMQIPFQRQKSHSTLLRSCLLLLLCALEGCTCSQQDGQEAHMTHATMGFVVRGKGWRRRDIVGTNLRQACRREQGRKTRSFTARGAGLLWMKEKVSGNGQDILDSILTWEHFEQTTERPKWELLSQILVFFRSIFIEQTNLYCVFRIYKEIKMKTITELRWDELDKKERNEQRQNKTDLYPFYETIECT